MEDSDQIKSDFDHSRDTYYDLIQKGQESLDLMMQFARESEHPRAFEVLSGMIKNISDVNDKLMDLNKKYKEVTATTKPALDAPSTVTNNNVFIGSTTDLQRMLIKNAEEQKVIDVVPDESQ